MRHFFGKTVMGTALATLAYLSRPEVFAILPKNVAAVVGGIGIILGAAGLRDAISKNGNGQ